MQIIEHVDDNMMSECFLIDLVITVLIDLANTVSIQAVDMLCVCLCVVCPCD